MQDIFGASLSAHKFVIDVVQVVYIRSEGVLVTSKLQWSMESIGSYCIRTVLFNLKFGLISTHNLHFYSYLSSVACLSIHLFSSVSPTFIKRTHKLLAEQRTAVGTEPIDQLAAHGSDSPCHTVWSACLALSASGQPIF